MKTNLPAAIKTVEEAQRFLSELFKNDEDFHPEDDATEMGFTREEGLQLNKLMDDIYSLPGNNSPSDLAFDPCEYLLDLDPQVKLK